MVNFFNLGVKARMKGKVHTDGNDPAEGKDKERKKRRYRSTKKHPYHFLNPEEMRRIRGLWGMSSRELGELLGVSTITVASWELGTNPIPSCVAMLLQILVDISGSRYAEQKFGLDEEVSMLEEE